MWCTPCAVRVGRDSRPRGARAFCQSCAFSGHGGWIPSNGAVTSCERRCVCSSIAMPPTSSRAARSMDAVSDPTGAAIRVVGWSADAVDPAPFLEPVDRERAGGSRHPADARVFLHVGNEAREEPWDCWPFSQRSKKAPALAGAGRLENHDPAGVTARSAQTLGLRDGVLGLGVTTTFAAAQDIGCASPAVHPRGLPGVVLEACAAGTRVLASDLQGP